MDKLSEGKRRTKDKIVSDLDREAITYYQDQIGAVQDMRREIADIWEQCKRMTDGYKDDPKYDWMSKIPITDAHDAVTRIAAQYNSEVEFEADPMPDSEGNVDDDDVAKAKLAAAIVNSTAEQAKLPCVLDTVKPALPTYGTQYVKLALVTETETTYEKKKKIKLYPTRKKNTNTGIAGVESEEQDYEEPNTLVKSEAIDAYVPSVFDVYVRPDEDDLQKAPFIAERKIEDIRDLRGVAEKRGYDNVDKLQPGMTREVEGDNSTSDTVRQYDFTTNNSQLSKHEVELFEVWGKVKKSWISQKVSDKDEWVEGYTLFGSGKNGAPVILKCTESPYGGLRPYVRFMYKRSPETNRQYGIGALEPVRGYFDMKGKLIDMLMDNGKMTWMNGYAIKPHVQASQLKPRPRMIVRTADPSTDIRPLDVKDITSPILKAIEIAEDNMRRGTGITDLQLGVESGGTATETGIMQDNASIFWQDIKRNYMKALNELGNMMLKILVYKKTGVSEFVRVWDDEKKDYDFVKWTPEDFANKNYQIRVKAQTVLNENNAIRANQLIKFADVFGDRMQLSPDEFRQLGKAWMKRQGMAQEAEEIMDQAPEKPVPEPMPQAMPPEMPMGQPMGQPPMGMPEMPAPMPVPPPAMGPAAGPMPMTPQGIQQQPMKQALPPIA